ncbi:MAG: M48 family metalloprotease [Kofleriaceae bacterium]
MNATSLIGFGVVFVLVGVTTSAALAWLVPRLAPRGPSVERRLATLAALLPVVLATAVVAILAIQSMIGVDHCTVDGHHAHLCLFHGMVWAERPWAIAVVAAGLAVVAARALAVLTSHLRGRALVARLRAKLEGDARVQLVPSARMFCVVAGLRRPTIYVSTAAREALAPDEWDAMLAHEASHIAHRDLWHRLALELLLLFAAPLAGIAIRERWEAATERLRDADAAERTSAEAVASALVHMARGQALARLAAVAPFTATGARLLALRVESLLDGAARGEPSARRLAGVALTSTAAVLALALAFAEPLHHALETLLG